MVAHRHRRADGPAVGLEPEDQRVARLLGALLGPGADGAGGARRLAGDGVDVGASGKPREAGPQARFPRPRSTDIVTDNPTDI